MHLRILDCNPDAPKTFRKPDLKVEHRNNELPEGLWVDLTVWARLHPPAYDERLVNDSIEVVDYARQFYDGLPKHITDVPPFDGTFHLLNTGRLGGKHVAHTFARSFVDIRLLSKMVYARERDNLYQLVRDIELALYRFNNPWGDSDWKMRWGIKVALQEGKDCPEWLVMFCAKWGVTINQDAQLPVIAYV